MKKLLACAVFLLGAMASAVSPAQDKNVFNSTVRHVDLNGKELMFLNTTRLGSKFNKIPDAVAKIASLDGAGRKEAAAVREAVAIVVRLLNPAAIQAFATSTRDAGNGIYVGKGFVRIGNGPTLFDAFAYRNMPMDWHRLPADTRFAIKGQIDLSRFLRQIENELQNATSPEIKGMAGFIDQLRHSGVDVRGLVNSIAGEFSILVTGDNLQNLAGRIEIPDKDGFASNMAKQILPVVPGTNYSKLPLPENQQIQARIYYLPGKIVAVSHPRMLNPQAFMTLGSLPDMRKLMPHLPANGYAYSLINIDAKTISSIKALAGKDMPPAVSALLTPIAFVSVGFKHSDGLGGVTAGNFEPANYAVAAPAIAAGTILPALSSARERSRMACCTNYLKQIGTACMQYMADHREQLPPHSGRAGLDMLVSGGYISSGVFYCPSNMGRAYIFIGGLKASDIMGGSTVPLAFDRPGSHKDRVNVLFCDGHVETVYVNNYREPSQVIAQLNRMYSYPARLVDKLLKAVSEN